MSKRYDEVVQHFENEFRQYGDGHTKTSPLSKIETATCAYEGTRLALEEVGFKKR